MARNHKKSAGRRKPKPLASKDVGLIVTEGEVTEPDYIDLLKQHLRSAGMQVSVKCVGVGKDPLATLKKAENYRNTDNREYDWCFVLVDVDDHTTLDRCLVEAAKLGVGVVVTNPCFELWLLWHHQDYSAHCEAKALKRKLDRYGHAGKELPLNFPVNSVSDACRRARKCDPHLAPNRKGLNPSSGMPLLIESLRR